MRALACLARRWPNAPAATLHATVPTPTHTAFGRQAYFVRHWLGGSKPQSTCTSQWCIPHQMHKHILLRSMHVRFCMLLLSCRYQSTEGDCALRTIWGASTPAHLGRVHRSTNPGLHSSLHLHPAVPLPGPAPQLQQLPVPLRHPTSLPPAAPTEVGGREARDEGAAAVSSRPVCQVWGVCEHEQVQCPVIRWLIKEDTCGCSV